MIHHNPSVKCFEVDAGDAVLHAQLRRASARRPASPLIIFSHGFITTGVENAGLFMRCARTFQEAGFDALLFDHVGCGFSSGDYTDFRVTRGARHLVTVADQALVLVPEASGIVVIGQSLGTAVAVLAASRFPEFSGRLRGLVLWHFSAEISTRYEALFGPGLLEAERFCVPHKGYVVSSDFVREMVSVDVLSEYSRMSAPTLFIESGNDEIGNPRFSEAALQSAPGASRRVVIEGANHSFSCQPEHEALAVQESVRFVIQISQSEPRA